MSTALAAPPASSVAPVAVPASTPPPVYTPPFGGMACLRKFTVDEYHRMIEAKILTEEDPVELLEGYLVLKMPRSLAHDFAIRSLTKELGRIVPDDYTLSSQCTATFDTSEPEPDFTIARGPYADYRSKHPGPADTAVAIECSASSLKRDRGDKAGIYARGGIPIYWVVNVEDRKIEVYSNPSGPSASPEYALCTEYAVGDSAPLTLDGKQVGAIAVVDVMV